MQGHLEGSGWNQHLPGLASCIEVLFELGALDDAIASDDERDTQLGAPALPKCERPRPGSRSRPVAGTVGTVDPDEPSFCPSMTAPARRSSVGTSVPSRSCPKRYSPFAKQKRVPCGLDSIRLQVGIRTACTTQQVDEDASAGQARRGGRSRGALSPYVTLYVRICWRYPLTTCPALRVGGGQLGDWG
jgi:hypothetical protein